MNILVTGGAGFIGSHVVDMLIERGDVVTVIDNLSSGNVDNLNPKAKFIQADINYVSLTETYDCIIHLAAQINLRQSIKDPANDAIDNIVGSLNIMNYAKDSKAKFIFASTGGAIYSPSEPLPWNEKTFTQPKSPYGLAKHTVENYLDMYNYLYGLDYSVLRFSNVYGPRQNAHGEAGVIAIFMEKILNNKSLTVFGDGNQTRDFVYVKDVVQACKLVVEQNLSGLFNVATNTETSVNDIVNLLKSYTKKQFEVIYTEAIFGELLQSRLSYNYLQQMSGWQPEYSLELGIKETIEHFQK